MDLMYVGFEVYMELKIHIVAFLVMPPCILVYGYKCFEIICDLIFSFTLKIDVTHSLETLVLVYTRNFYYPTIPRCVTYAVEKRRQIKTCNLTYE
jgi:hypothetical protein